MIVTVRVANLGVWGVSPSRGLGRKPQWGVGRSPAKKILAFWGTKNTDFTGKTVRELHPATSPVSTSNVGLPA